MALLGTGFDETVPADNTAVRLGAQRIRELKTLIKAFMTPSFNLETGAIGVGKVTSANLAVPADVTPAYPLDTPSGGVNSYNYFEINAKGQVIAASLESVHGEDLDEGSITAQAMDEDSVTQRSLKNNEVTPEKIARPERWVRFDCRPRSITGLAAVDGIATGSIVGLTYSGAALAVGSTVVISGSNNSAFNGTFTVTSVSYIDDDTIFTYDTGTEYTGSSTGTEIVDVHISAMSWHLDYLLWNENISALTRDEDGIVHVTTSGIQHFNVGDHVRIMGAYNRNGLCGEFVITSVSDYWNFTYFAGFGGGSGDGYDGVTDMTVGLLKPDCTVATWGVGLPTVTWTRPFTDSTYGVLITVGCGSTGQHCTAHADSIYYDRVEMSILAVSTNAAIDAGHVTVHALGSNEYQVNIPT